MRIISLFIFIFLFSISFASENSNIDYDNNISCEYNLSSSKFLSINDNISYNLSENNFCYKSGINIINEKNINLNCNDLKILGNLNNWSGINIINSKNISISNCDMENFYFGIFIKNSKNVLIENNLLMYNYGGGIYLLNSSNITIIKNKINNNSYDGIFLEFSSNNKIMNNSITYNEVDAIQIFTNSTKNFIEYNNLSFTNGHSIAPIICDNYFGKYNIGGNGKKIKVYSNKNKIKLFNSNIYSEILICNVNGGIFKNISLNNGYFKTDGFLVVNSKNISISNSNLKNVRAGIYLYNSNYLKIFNNSFYDNDYALRFMKSSQNSKIFNNFFDKKNKIIIRSFFNSKNNSFYSNFIGNSTKINFNYSNDFKIYTNNSNLFLENISIYGNKSLLYEKVLDYNLIFIIIIIIIILLN